jgi:hypothetical protein
LDWRFQIANQLRGKEETTMSCMTLTAQDITMTTTQFTRALDYESCMPVKQFFVSQHQPLRMNWVVVIDENGNRRLQMGWHTDRGD